MALQLSNEDRLQRHGDFLNGLMALGQPNSKFEETELWKYAELARQAYVEGPNGYTEVVSDDHERIIGKKDGGEAWLGFRGSLIDRDHSWPHWFSNGGNLNVLTNSDSTFRGFKNALSPLIEPLKEWCRGCRVINLTGHSRGGAFATLLGHILAEEFKDAKIKVVVFGCPRVGESKFAERFRDKRNLLWAGFQHSQDEVGKAPPWGEHIYPPLNPLTDFETKPFALVGLASDIAKGAGYSKTALAGKALNAILVSGSNAFLKAHSMESYYKSLKCNFVLRSSTGGAVEEFIDTIAADSKQKAMLTIAVQATETAKEQISQQVKQVANEFKELLSAGRLKNILSDALIQEKVDDVSGTTELLATMYSMDDIDGIKAKMHDLEQELRQLKQRLDKPDKHTRMLLVECCFKCAYVLAMCRLKVGNTVDQLKKRFGELASSFQSQLLQLAKDFDAEAFYEGLRSLARVEAACLVHLENTEPVFLTEEVQDELLPTEFERWLRKFARHFEAKALESPDEIAQLLSLNNRFGQEFIDRLESILKEAECPSGNEHLTKPLTEALKEVFEESTSLKTKMSSLTLPEVVLTGPTKAGKSSLLNALLGKDVLSTDACPDSFLPIRVIPDAGGSKFCLEPRGTGISDNIELFKSRLDEEFAEALVPREFNTAEEVQKAVKKVNRSFREFLGSDKFTETFEEEEDRVRLRDLYCADWTIDMKLPMGKNEKSQMKSMILTDLPGSTEGGILGQFLRTMVVASCKRASTALFVLGFDQVTELGRDDPVQRFLGGKSNFVSYFLVITKVFEKETLDQVSPTAAKKVGMLEPQPMLLRYINSYLLRAYADSKAGSLPQKFPEEEEEQRRCRNIFQGVEGRLMKPKDEKRFDGEELKENLREKLEEFPATTEFTKELSSSVACNFPDILLGPRLARTQEHLQAIIWSLQKYLRVCRLKADKREAEILACKEALRNLEANVKLYVDTVQTRTLPSETLEKRIHEIEENVGKGKDLSLLNFEKMKSLFDAEVADVYQRNVKKSSDGSVQWNREIFEAIEKCWIKEVAEVLDAFARTETSTAFPGTAISVRSSLDEAISCWEDSDERKPTGKLLLTGFSGLRFAWTFVPADFSGSIFSAAYVAWLSRLGAAAANGLHGLVFVAEGVSSGVAKLTATHEPKAIPEKLRKNTKEIVEQVMIEETMEPWARKTLDSRLKELNASKTENLESLEKAIEKNLHVLGQITQLSAWAKRPLKQSLP